jgi:serine protease Do
LGDLSKEMAETLGLGRPRGAYVRNVEPNGPAASGGIEAGDVILAFNGRDISKSSDLPRIVGETKPGMKATVQVWRKGSARDLTVLVADAEATTKTAAAKKPDSPASAATSNNPFGLGVTELSDAKKRELNVKSGVEITSLGEGAAARSGIRVGDVIVRVGDSDVTGVKQFEGLTKGLDASRAVALFVRRADSTLIVPLKPKAP